MSALASDCAGDLAWPDAAPVSPGHSAMSHFVPPYPDRPREPLPPLAMLRAVRRNFLAAFDDKCFEYQLFTVQMLRRRLFVCNSPDTVAQAFIAMHDSFERKTPQMRHALHPLLGDGLFISDGRTWKERRAHRRADRACLAIAAVRADHGRGGDRDGRALGGTAGRCADRCAARDGDADRRDHLPDGVRAAPRPGACDRDRRLVQRVPARSSDSST